MGKKYPKTAPLRKVTGLNLIMRVSNHLANTKKILAKTYRQTISRNIAQLYLLTYINRHIRRFRQDLNTYVYAYVYVYMCIYIMYIYKYKKTLRG